MGMIKSAFIEVVCWVPAERYESCFAMLYLKKKKGKKQEGKGISEVQFPGVYQLLTSPF